jgi:hypothetical protein
MQCFLNDFVHKTKFVYTESSGLWYVGTQKAVDFGAFWIADFQEYICLLRYLLFLVMENLILSLLSFSDIW